MEAMKVLFTLIEQGDIGYNELSTLMGRNKNYVNSAKHNGNVFSIDKYVEAMSYLGYEVVLVEKKSGIEITL